MTRIQVTPELQCQVQRAMVNPYRFERCERFAMREVLKAWDEHYPAEEIFVVATNAALTVLGRPHALAVVDPPPPVAAAA